jgi:hypothetical protein
MLLLLLFLSLLLSQVMNGYDQDLGLSPRSWKLFEVLRRRLGGEVARQVLLLLVLVVVVVVAGPVGVLGEVSALRRLGVLRRWRTGR